MNDDNVFKYYRTFTDNILVAGQTGHGKTTFVQNLSKSRMFGPLEYVHWISKINFLISRELDISSFFDYTTAEYHYP